MQKCMSRTKGKENFFQQSQLNLRVSRYKLLLLLTNRKKTGVFSCSILNRNRKREPSAFRKTPTGHHGFDCRSYRGRSCRMQGWISNDR